MEFIQHTINWVKAELLEAWLILAFGLITVIVGYLFWKMGDTPNAKALLWPLVLSGFIYAAIGGGMLFSNYRRLEELPKNYQLNPSAFISTEQQRVEAFQYGYTISKIVATLFFTFTLLIFWSTKNPTWMGIGIGLAYFAIAGLVVDYFSQERADLYYKAILTGIKG